MTVAALSPSIQYVENGVTTAFAVPFRFKKPTDILATRILVDGTVVPLAYGSGYSVTGGATDAGGTLTVAAAAAAGVRLLLDRATARVQAMEYSTGDTFPAKSHEGAIDHLTLVDQEQDVLIGDISQRAPMVPQGAIAPGLDLGGLMEGDILSFRDGLLKRLQREAFAGKFYAGDAGGKFVPASGTGVDPGLREDLAEEAGTALLNYQRTAEGWRRPLRSRLNDMPVTPEDFGAIGDGTVHMVAEWIGNGPLGVFPSLAALQIVYPHVTSTSDYIDWAAAQKAINEGRGVVEFAARSYMMNHKLILPNNVSVKGCGMGYGSNWRTRIQWDVTSGAIDSGFEFRGFYAELDGFLMEYTGPVPLTTNPGINFARTGGVTGGAVTKAFVSNVALFNFGVGITNSKAPTSFTLLMHNVFIAICEKAMDLAYVNNVVLDACFFGSNGDGIVADSFFNMTLCNGTVLQVINDDAPTHGWRERNDSTLLKLSNGKGFSWIGGYSEVGTGFIVPGTAAKIAELSNVQGFLFKAIYIGRSTQDQAPMIYLLDNDCSGIEVTNNPVNRGPSLVDNLLVGGAPGAESAVYKARVWGNSVKQNVSGGRLIEKDIRYVMHLTENGAIIADRTYSGNAHAGTIMVSGDSCTVTGEIVLTAKGTPVPASLDIVLPSGIKCRSYIGSQYPAIGSLALGNFTSNPTSTYCRILPGSNVISLRNGPSSAFTGAHLNDNSRLGFSITFPIDTETVGV